MNNSYIKRSFLNAFGVLAYVSAVASFMFHGKGLFPGEDNFLMPILMLLLLIVSAATTGFLVFGKPIMLYLDGAKKEAFSMLLATIGWLALFLLIVFVALLLW